MAVAVTAAILAACLALRAYRAGRLDERSRAVEILRRKYDRVHDDFGGMAAAAMTYILGEILNEIAADHPSVPDS